MDACLSIFFSFTFCNKSIVVQIEQQHTASQTASYVLFMCFFSGGSGWHRIMRFVLCVTTGEESICRWRASPAAQPSSSDQLIPAFHLTRRVIGRRSEVFYSRGHQTIDSPKRIQFGCRNQAPDRSFISSRKTFLPSPEKLF